MHLLLHLSMLLVGAPVVGYAYVGISQLAARGR